MLTVGRSSRKDATPRAGVGKAETENNEAITANIHQDRRLWFVESELNYLLGEPQTAIVLT
jgi:hypothetical protein